MANETIQEVPTVSNIYIYPIKSCHAVEVAECAIDSLGLQYDRKWTFMDTANNMCITQRKYPSLALITPSIDALNNRLVIAAPDINPLIVSLELPIPNTLEKRQMRIFGDKVNVHDVGDEASAWIMTFLKHSQFDHDEISDDIPVSSKSCLRLVRIDPADYERIVDPRFTRVYMPLTDESPISIGCESSLGDLNDHLVNERIGGEILPMSRFRNNITVHGSPKWDEDQWLIVRIGEVILCVLSGIPRCIVPGIDQDTAQKDYWGSPGPKDFLAKYHFFPGSTGDGFFCMHALPLNSGKISKGDRVEILERTERKSLKLIDFSV